MIIGDLVAQSGMSVLRELRETPEGPNEKKANSTAAAQYGVASVLQPVRA